MNRKKKTELLEELWVVFTMNCKRMPALLKKMPTNVFTKNSWCISLIHLVQEAVLFSVCTHSCSLSSSPSLCLSVFYSRRDIKHKYNEQKHDGLINNMSLLTQYIWTCHVAVPVASNMTEDMDLNSGIEEIVLSSEGDLAWEPFETSKTSKFNSFIFMFYRYNLLTILIT